MFFDNLQITHLPGALLEETHYYPFGLAMAGISSKAAGRLENRKRYNGYEENKDLDLNQNESFFRLHDPQLGRFLQMDPKPSEREGLYTAMGNNPVLMNDLLGDTIGLGGDRESMIKFIKLLQARSGNDYCLNEDNSISRVKNVNKSKSPIATSTTLAILIDGVINSKKRMQLNFSNKNSPENESIFMDDFASSTIDVNDIVGINSDILQAATIGHIIGEYKDAPDSKKLRNDPNIFDIFHSQGIIVESLIVSEMTGQKYNKRDQQVLTEGNRVQIIWSYGSLQFSATTSATLNGSPTGIIVSPFSQLKH